MKFASFPLTLCLFCLPTLVVSAQDGPSGSSDNSQSSDPFADSPNKAADDPFADPGDKTGADPFAATTGNASTDPVGGTKKPKSPGLGGGDLGSLEGFAKRKAVTIDRQAASERIRKALGHSTSQNFDETPLVEAVRDLSASHEIPMVVDGRALEEIGLSVEEPVTIALDRVSLGSFLRLMLREMELTYTIQDEVLVITSHEAAVQNLIVRAYSLNSSLLGSSNQVAALMKTAVAPSAWTEQGGHATAVPILGNVVVVSATETLHEKVEDLLMKLDKALDE